jgi:hypothetical protein
MASSIDLFNFIKSLESNEKRYFQLQASLQTGEKNYLLLFDAMYEQDVYNKEAIIEAFGDKKFVKNLHVTENYLFKRILESLRAFHCDSSINARIYNLLFDAEILEQRGFYKLTEEVLKRAEKLATKHQKSFILVEILFRKIALSATHNHKLLLEQLEDLYRQVHQVVQDLSQESMFTYVHYWFSLVFRKWRVPDDKKVQNQMFEHYTQVIEQGFPQNGTFYTKYYYYTIQSLYLQIARNYEAGTNIHQQIIELWEAYPQMKKEKPSIYIARLANYINNCITCEKYDLAYRTISKMEELKVHSFDAKGELFQNIYFYKQFYYINVLDLKSAKKLIPEMEKGLSKYAAKISPGRMFSFYYNTTITYFLLEEYELAAEWLNKIIDITRTDELRKDIQRFARILQLVIYYQLSSNDVLEYMFRSVYRNKKLKEEMQEFEMIVLKKIKKLLNYPKGSRNTLKLFKAFYEELKALKDREYKETGFEEFFIWISIMAGERPSFD